MDYTQEQNDEIEALRAIFDDLQVSDEQPKSITFNINCELVSLTLVVTYVDKYPDEPPNIAVTPVASISEEDCAQLLEKLNQQAAESVGMAMVFALQAAAKDFVDDQNAALQRAEAERRRKEEEQASLAEVEKHIIGTIVTSESFEIWRQSYMKEVQIQRDAQDALDRAAKKGRLTGRQLFERDASLRTSDIKEIAADEVAVDTSLFADLDMEDIDAVAEEPARAALFGGETFSDLEDD